MKGFDLFTYCVTQKYIKDQTYVQTLRTLFMHLQNDLYPLLEKAEENNKKLSLKDDDSLIINDSYNLDNVLIV